MAGPFASAHLRDSPQKGTVAFRLHVHQWKCAFGLLCVCAQGVAHVGHHRLRSLGPRGSREPDGRGVDWRQVPPAQTQLQSLHCRILKGTHHHFTASLRYVFTTNYSLFLLIVYTFTVTFTILFLEPCLLSEPRGEGHDWEGEGHPRGTKEY